MFLFVQSLNDIIIGPGLVRFIILGVLEQNLVHVCGRVLEQFVARVKDDQRDLTVTQHRQLIRFFHQTELAFCECDLSVPFVCDPGDLDLLAPHDGGGGGGVYSGTSGRGRQAEQCEQGWRPRRNAFRGRASRE